VDGFGGVDRLEQEAVRNGIGVEGDDLDPIAEACRELETLVDGKGLGRG
jgi:hypothetical protein